MSNRMGPAAIAKPLSDALGTEHCSLNYYELDPGDSTAFGFHAHEDQEEIFFVLEGSVVFETAGGEVPVEEDELIRFHAGEFQRCKNQSDQRARLLAIGAPREAGETTILRACPTCGGRTEHDIELTDGHDAITTVCQECHEETGRYTT